MNENRGDNVMQRHEVLKILADHRDAMRQQFGVKSLALFGSVARDEATETSDVDLLVAFARPVGLFGLYALQDYLVQLLGCAVDVGTLDSLKPRIRARVLAESIDVS
jgi:predicted nucleotidyltransferase